MKPILILLSLFLTTASFAQKCPKDTAITKFDPKTMELHTWQTTYHIKNGKCIKSDTYWLQLPSGKKIQTTKKEFDKQKTTPRTVFKKS